MYDWKEYHIYLSRTVEVREQVTDFHPEKSTWYLKLEQQIIDKYIHITLHRRNEQCNAMYI